MMACAKLKFGMSDVADSASPVCGDVVLPPANHSFPRRSDHEEYCNEKQVSLFISSWVVACAACSGSLTSICARSYVCPSTVHTGLVMIFREMGQKKILGKRCSAIVREIKRRIICGLSVSFIHANTACLDHYLLNIDAVIFVRLP